MRLIELQRACRLLGVRRETLDTALDEGAGPPIQRQRGVPVMDVDSTAVRRWAGRARRAEQKNVMGG